MDHEEISLFLRLIKTGQSGQQASAEVTFELADFLEATIEDEKLKGLYERACTVRKLVLAERLIELANVSIVSVQMAQFKIGVEILQDTLDVRAAELNKPGQGGVMIDTGIPNRGEPSV